MLFSDKYFVGRIPAAACVAVGPTERPWTALQSSLQAAFSTAWMRKKRQLLDVCPFHSMLSSPELPGVWVHLGQRCGNRELLQNRGE